MMYIVTKYNGGSNGSISGAATSQAGWDAAAATAAAAAAVCYYIINTNIYDCQEARLFISLLHAICSQ